MMELCSMWIPYCVYWFIKKGEESMNSNMRKMYTEEQIVHLVEENGKIDFSKLVDKDGHNRFIEGNITISNTLTGFTQRYGKWSLSGTHLLIVVAITIDNATVVAANTVLCSIILPQWVKDKIVPLAGVYVDNKTISLRADDYTQQQIGSTLNKGSSDLYITLGTLTLNAERTGRFAFDLLIDNE